MTWSGVQFSDDSLKMPQECTLAVNYRNPAQIIYILGFVNITTYFTEIVLNLKVKFKHINEIAANDGKET